MLSTNKRAAAAVLARLELCFRAHEQANEPGKNAEVDRNQIYVLATDPNDCFFVLLGGDEAGGNDPRPHGSQGSDCYGEPLDSAHPNKSDHKGTAEVSPFQVLQWASRHRKAGRLSGHILSRLELRSQGRLGERRQMVGWFSAATYREALGL